MTRCAPTCGGGGAAFPENQSVQAAVDERWRGGHRDVVRSGLDRRRDRAGGCCPKARGSSCPRGEHIGNVSFVAIPYNAAHAEGAMVVANLLLDPEVQARMQNIEVLGSFSVLDPARLDATAQARFDALPSAPALPGLDELGPTLPEPHASWMTRLTEEWARRYTR